MKDEYGTVIRWFYPFPSIKAWIKYHFRWKGWAVKLPKGQPYTGQPDWTLHECPDGPCRSGIGGGCAIGWCAHHKVKPDEAFVPRLPKTTYFPIIKKIK